MIKNITDEFAKFLLTSREYYDFAPTIGIFGNRGGGKTCLAFEIHTMLLSGDQEPHYIDGEKFYRNVAIFRAPDRLLEEIKKSFPAKLASRFRIIDDIYDAKPFEIIYIDEAAQIFDGKLALKKENREIMGGFTYARHNRIPVIYCTVKPKVLQDLKIMTEIFIYKRLSKRFIRAFQKEGDDFVKEHEDTLLRLKIDRALIDSDYKYFPGSGGLAMPKKKYCPFYTEGISTNMRGQNLAHERSQEMEIKEAMEPLIQEIIKRYGPELKKGHSSKLVRGWLLNEKPLIAETFKDSINDIVARAFQIWHDKHQEDDIKHVTLSEIKVPNLIEIDETTSGFYNFLEDFYMENLSSHVAITSRTTIEKEKIIEVLLQWAEGIGIRDITVSLDKHKTIPQITVQKIIKIFNNGEGVVQNDLRLFSCYEHWIAWRTGAKVFSGLGNPDLIFQMLRREFPGECKLYNNVQKNIAMDKRELLKPSLKFCIENNIPNYPVFFRNTKWGDVDFVFNVNVEGSNIVNFEPLDNNILKNFNPDIFWSKYIDNKNKAIFDKKIISKMADTIIKNKDSLMEFEKK